MKELRDMHWAIRDNLTRKGNPDMVDCRHRETEGKTYDNRRTSIDNTTEKGVKHYENIRTTRNG